MGNVIRSKFWQVVAGILLVGFIVQVCLTYHWVGERDEQIREQRQENRTLEAKVLIKEVEIDDLKQTNDQLKGELNLASEYIEQLQREGN